MSSTRPVTVDSADDDAAVICCSAVRSASEPFCCAAWIELSMVVVALRNIEEKKPPVFSVAVCAEGRGGCAVGWLMLGTVFAVGAVSVAAIVVAVAVVEEGGCSLLAGWLSEGGCDVVVVVVVDDDDVGVVSPMRIKSLYDCVCSSMSMERVRGSLRADTWAGV